MRLTLTVSDSFVNPYAPSHPYNEVLETMNKVNEEKKKAVEEGIQHERTKVELITNISHDLKTPLTAITNYVEFLSKESLNQTNRDYVEVISNKVKKTK